MSLSFFSYELAAATVGLVVISSLAFALLGIDDLFLDLAFWIYKIHRTLKARGFKGLTLEQLKAKEQQRIAIFVPCWQEEEIVGKMIELTARTLQYRHY